MLKGITKQYLYLMTCDEERVENSQSRKWSAYSYVSPKLYVAKLIIYHVINMCLNVPVTLVGCCIGCDS